MKSVLKTTFICTDCGEELPFSELSKSSMLQAGSRNRMEALQSLARYQTTCAACADLTDIQEAPVRTYNPYGDRLSRAERDWLNLYY